MSHLHFMKNSIEMAAFQAWLTDGLVDIGQQV